MFGERIGFNIQGEEKFKTCCGAVITFAIFIFCAMYFVYIILDVFENRGNYLVQTPSTSEYFPQEEGHSADTGFKFAITVSSPRNFRGQNWDYIERYSSFTLNMIDIVAEDGNFVDATETVTAVEMVRCDGTEGFYEPLDN